MASDITSQANSKSPTDVNAENEAKKKAEEDKNKKRKKVIIGVVALVVIAGGLYWAYKKGYIFKKNVAQ